MNRLYFAATILLVSASLYAGSDDPKYGADASPWGVPVWKDNAYFRTPDSQNSDFWLLVGYYFPQPNDYSCSAGALTPVLNAALTTLPRTEESPVISPQKLIAAVTEGDWQERVSDQGFLPSGSSNPVHGVEFAKFPQIVEAAFRHFGLKDVQARAIRMETPGGEALSALRRDLLANEGNPRNFMLADIDQGKFNGGEEAGHWVAVGAYDAGNDRVLIFDPDREDYEPYWVPVETLAAAMATLDKSSNQNRGYVLISF
jgi:hypothetical protein